MYARQVVWWAKMLRTDWSRIFSLHLTPVEQCRGEDSTVGVCWRLLNGGEAVNISSHHARDGEPRKGRHNGPECSRAGYSPMV